MIKVCTVDELKPGTAIGVEIEGVPVAVVRTADGSVHALRDECSHASVPLSEGEITGCTLECWLHGSRFDLRTGKPLGPPATEPVPVFPVQVTGADVLIDLNPTPGDN